MQDVMNIAAGLLHIGGLGELPKLMAGPLGDASNFIFYREVNGFLRDSMEDFGANLLTRSMAWVGSVALTMLTLWIMIQGYRIVTGRSREPMIVMVVGSMRSVLIIGVATGMAIGGTTLYDFFTNGLTMEITRVITGKDEGDIYESIDRSLGYMQLALGSIDALHTGGSQIIQDAKSRNMWFAGVGTAGPALVAGGMLLFYKGMMALLLGLGPICVASLLFEQTKSLFQKWVFYWIGTLTALAVLNVMATLSLDMITAVAASFWTGKLMGSNPEGISSLAMQQGALGLLMTTMIVSMPPAAAALFNGLLGQFASYSAFGSLRGGSDSAGRTPGSPGYTPQPSNNHATEGPQKNRPHPDANDGSAQIRTHGSSNSTQADVVKPERRGS